MITVMQDIPAHVAAFTASGEVTKTDYDTVLIPRIEEVNKTHGHIHFLFELKTDVSNFTAAAWWKDFLIGQNTPYAEVILDFYKFKNFN